MSKAASFGTSNSRRSAGSGSDRQRSVGSVRSLVNTTLSGVVAPAVVMASVASTGTRIISVVGSRPTSIVANPTPRIASPNGDTSVPVPVPVIRSVIRLGAVVGSMSMR